MIRHFLLISILCSLGTSCSSSSSVPDEPEPKPLSSPEAIIQKLPPVEINLKEIDPIGLKAEIEKHKGKVVLVDFWALWCPPCLESFYHLSEWYLKYSEKGLVVITINLDEDNAENRQKVISYLQKQRAPFETFICREEPTNEIMQAFGIDGEALPHCQIYNREGKHVISLGNYDPDRIYDERSISTALEKQFAAPPLQKL